MGLDIVGIVRAMEWGMKSFPEYQVGQKVMVKHWNSPCAEFVQRPARIARVNYYDGDWQYEVYWLDVDVKNSLVSQSQGSLRANLISVQSLNT